MSFMKLVGAGRTGFRLIRPLGTGPPYTSQDFTGVPKGKYDNRPDRNGVPDDYPDVPFISYQDRPPHGWMDTAGRRNLNTPLHVEDDMLSMWLFDRPPPRYTKTEQMVQLFTALGMLGLFTYVCVVYDRRVGDVAVPRQYPRNNLYIERGYDPALEPEVFTDCRVRNPYPPR